MGQRTPLEDRFWTNVVKTETCWLWTASRTRDSYGRTTLNRKYCSAHRAAWFLTYGRWPVNQLDHLCRVRHCVNPDHLEDVTQVENVLRGVGPSAKNAVKTHCIWGHAYSVENTALWRSPRGGTRRKCRACARVYNRKRYWAARIANAAEAKP